MMVNRHLGYKAAIEKHEEDTRPNIENKDKESKEEFAFALTALCIIGAWLLRELRACRIQWISTLKASY